MALSPDALWKDRPCHFTWNLTVNHYEFDKIVRNIDSDLRDTPNLLRVEQLLFRAYLEVSGGPKHRNVCKAREFLDEADKYIKDIQETSLKKGYKYVALLNHIWIDHKTKNCDNFLSDLHNLEVDEKALRVTDAVKAAALTRLGPGGYDTAMKLFEGALQDFPSNPNFLYGAALMTGRKMRYRRNPRDGYNDLDAEGKKLMNDEKKYWIKMMKGNDEYGLAMSNLGLNLSRRGEKQKIEGSSYLEKAYKKAPNVPDVFLNLMRYYRENNQVDKAITELKRVIREVTTLDISECHYQLAVCYKAIVISHESQQLVKAEVVAELNKDTLDEIDKCLETNERHIYALLDKGNLLSRLGRHEEANNLYENKLQESENLTPENTLDLYFAFAKSAAESRIDIWQKVMDTTQMFEYLDQSGEWKVRNKAKKPKEKAYGILLEHYKDNGQHLGILYFQNFEFAKAEEALMKLNHKTDVKIPRYLAETYLKWGREKEMKAGCQPEDAAECFRKARTNVKLAIELGLNQEQGQQLLADTSLAMAHYQMSNAPRCQTIPLESECIKSYREAVRCGSLVASLELLRLIQKDYIKENPRSEYLQILAETDVCCSRSDCLHLESKPLSFKRGPNSRDTDGNLLDMDCDMIKEDIKVILEANEFYRPAWKAHFTMEKEVLQNQGQQLTPDIVDSIVHCCLELRPLLDKIIAIFADKKLSNRKKNLYFPLIRDGKDDTDIEKQLKERFRDLKHLGINMDQRYPILFQRLLENQPGFKSQTDTLLKLIDVVNQVKHGKGSHTEILSLCNVGDPVDLVRQSTNKVETICNGFFDEIWA